MTNENTLAVMDNFTIQPLTNASPDTVIDDLDDFEGIMMTFPRIKIPGGGSTVFEVPSDDPQKPNNVPAIEGIILYNHNTNAYWEEGSEYDMNTSPVCTSVDGKTGYGDPGGACAECPFNQYGTDTNGGKGKACKNMRSLYILQNNAPLPINLLLPPTSLKAFNDFTRTAFIMRNRKPWGSLVRIELRKESNGSNNYAVATFKLLGDFTGEKLAEVIEYAKVARAGINEMLKQRAINVEELKEPTETFTEIVDDGSEPNGDPFSAVEV